MATPAAALDRHALVWDQAERVGAWVASKVGVEGFVPPYSSLGWQRGGELVGGIIFNVYTGPNVELTVACDGPVPPSILGHVRRYVFDQHKCRRMTITAKASRPDVIDQAKRLGFTEEGFHPELFADDDGVTLGILAKDCHWSMR